MDIVVPYRKSMSNEIVYMMRSLKNLPHHNVYVFGDDPELSNKVIHVPYKQTIDISLNTLTIVNMACADQRVSNNFIFMHDDFYIMNKVYQIPTFHRGSYKSILERYQIRRKRGFYVLRMERTYKKLISMGVTDPLCYELHIPFVINKKKWESVSRHITKDLNKLSMYGNLNKLGGTQISDVKVHSRDKIPNGNFISTHDTTFGTNQVGKLIRDKFSVRCKYERN